MHLYEAASSGMLKIKLCNKHPRRQKLKRKEYENTTIKIHTDFINGILQLNISPLPSEICCIQILNNKE
jgi:hypothetical protein